MSTCTKEAIWNGVVGLAEDKTALIVFLCRRKAWFDADSCIFSICGSFEDFRWCQFMMDTKLPNIILILLSLWSQAVIIALIKHIRIAINFTCLTDYMTLTTHMTCINSRAVYDCLVDITFQRMGFTWWVKSFSKLALVPHHWFLLDTVPLGLLTVTFETCILSKAAWNNMFCE